MTAERPVVILTLRPELNGDPMMSLKAMLKAMLRNHGWRCIKIEIESNPKKDLDNA